MDHLIFAFQAAVSDPDGGMTGDGQLEQALADLEQKFADSEDDETSLALVYEMQFLSKLLVAADQLGEKLLDY